MSDLMAGHLSLLTQQRMSRTVHGQLCLVQPAQEMIIAKFGGHSHASRIIVHSGTQKIALKDLWGDLSPTLH